MAINSKHDNHIKKLEESLKKQKSELTSATQARDNAATKYIRYRSDAKRSGWCLFIALMILGLSIIVSFLKPVRDFTSTLSAFAIDHPGLFSAFFIVWAAGVVNVVLVRVSTEDNLGKMFAYLIFSVGFLLWPVGLIYLFAEYDLNKGTRSTAQNDYHKASDKIEKLTKEIAATEKELKQVNAHVQYAINLYEQAKKENDDELMKKAASLGDVKAAHYLRRKEGEQKYQLYIDEGMSNTVHLKEAADLKYPTACLEYGKVLYLESNSNEYTKSEKEVKAKQAAEYLEIVLQSDECSSEAEFLWLACTITYEIGTADKWRAKLARARKLKERGDVPQCYWESLDLLIKLLVETVDSVETKQKKSDQRYAERRIRTRCRFFNAGICNHKSNEFFIYKCTDPVRQSCSYALLNHGIIAEEY